jgi:RNA polymerase sigma-32 factor
MDRLPEYVAAAHAAPFISPEEERELVRAMKAGSSRALERLILSHLRMVTAMAKRYARRNLSYADLVSEGTLGLLEAARRFDPSRSRRFSVYAAWWVRAYIRKYALDNRRIVGAPSTRSARRLFGNLGTAERRITQEEGRPATAAEVAAALGVSADDVTMVECALSAHDVPIGHAGRGHVVEPVARTPDPEELAARHEEADGQRTTLVRALRALTRRERIIMRRRHLTDEPSTLTEIGRELGISRERVRQIEQAAREKLRATCAKDAAA